MRILFVSCLAVIVMVAAVDAQWPKAVIAEDCTATWCQYCPYAYAGLEVMKERYDSIEFNSVRYYSTTGGYGTPETDGRISYYGVTGFPTVIFNGTTRVVGGSPTTATGSVYDPIVANGIAEPSPLKITINSVDLVDPGSIDFDIEVIEAIEDIGNVKIRTLLLENDLNAEDTDVTRDVLPDVPLTVSEVGQIQNVVHNFSIDPGWTHELWMAVFVQDDDDRSIWQSASTRPAPEYSIRFWAKGSRGAIIPSAGAYEFEDFAVFNLGTSPDVIRVTLDQGTMPADWDCVFTDGVVEYTSYVDLALNPGEHEIFHVRITPASPGYAQPRIVLTSDNLPDVERAIRYNVVTDDVDVLLVDDDGAEDYDAYHTDALQNYGASFGVWDRDLAELSTTDLVTFDTVVWQTGFSFPTLTDADRAALGAYLDGGGNLFITGQDIGWDTWDQGGPAITWYRTYLHTNYQLDDTNRNYVSGVDGDPVGGGIQLTLIGGDGANNNDYPSAVNPYDASATTIFKYDGTNYNAGTRADNGVHKVVYLAFPYESIDNADDRRLVTARILDWFAGTSDAPDAAAVLAAPGVRAFPSPAAGQATLSYRLPAAGPAKLEIYALDGSLVRTLASGRKPAGHHTVRWDGRDNSGHEVPAGIYFYRLTAGDAMPSGRLVLAR